MGKKGRKTRWRTLTITDEHSDSEESNTTTSEHRVPKGYPQKSYYSRFTYSSQSTPTRRYQCDGTKSTRSSSTASENKITFNEDEYTRITTPRQDVLFKKGYLNKPKTYQTQTSTGNSTTSTGNSTGNGTPDHQSTDLEYESQFVFPNGFVDQNGIYYVNSFEPYPLMVFNPPTYYPEFTNVKSKRCSTGSLTESTSPNNEEASQDLSQSETPSNVSDFNHVYNVIYPGFYYNGACQPQDVASQPEPRRMKKRRRRKVSRSKSVQDGTTSEYTDESSDEVFSDHQEAEKPPEEAQDSDRQKEEKKVDAQKLLLDSLVKENGSEDSIESTTEETEEKKEETEEKKEETEEKKEETEEKAEDGAKSKYDLKPDAEEFVPRAYRHPETIPMEANVQFIKIPSNFVPLPILNPLSDFNAFIPPGIPINFIPQNFINFIPSNFVGKADNAQLPKQVSEKAEEEIKETVEVPKNRIDIAKIVSKLEEAAKEQDNETVEENKAEGGAPKQRKATNIKKNKHQKVEEDKTKPETKETKISSKPNSPKKEATPLKPVTRNYSDLLKKPPTVQTQQCERHERHMERQKLDKTATKEVKIVKIEPKTSNQWISVSNRKKRKNKNVEETEDFGELEEADKDKDLFEKYDVQDLVDVVPISAPAPPTPPPPPQEPEAVQKTETTPLAVEPPKDETKEEEKPKSASKKKSKKTPKPPVRRVIIKDVDLSQEVPKIVEEKVEEVVVPEEKKIEVVEEKTPEKKAKKKKKKATKLPIPSESSSSTTLNVFDDSYDFLLESSLLEESQEKTNVEVSQELDKMIQRGMYSSLEEKIKSLNMESNDSFFKTIIHNISSRESSVEKSSYSNPPDFARLLTATPPLLKTMPITDPDLGDFLGESTPKTVGGPDRSSPDDLYPITKAVKEWMTKTRETTPDVEILKSPSTILREFGDLQAKNGDGSSLSAGLFDGDLGVDDEVTVYAFGRERSADLLDCCEDEPKTAPSSIEEGEDVLEIYDSRYGKNEDFLKIRAEVEEKKASGYPKHGNLPYRAICCSIM